MNLGDSLFKKIANCFAQHRENKSSWDAGAAEKLSWQGPVNGSKMKGSWTLVSVYHPTKKDGAVCDNECREIWRDDRTGILWSDVIQVGPATQFNWCVASGSADLARDTGRDLDDKTEGKQDCGDSLNLNQNKFSLCEEKAGFVTPADTFAMKGNIGVKGGVIPAMQGKSFRAENNNERRSGIFRFTGKKTRYSYDTEIGDDISYSEVASSFANVRCLAHN